MGRFSTLDEMKIMKRLRVICAKRHIVKRSKDLSINNP